MGNYITSYFIEQPVVKDEKVSIKLLEPLPYVIILKICSFVKIILLSERNVYSHKLIFGYFKRDVCRKIFTIFRNIEFDYYYYGPIEGECKINSSKIKTLMVNFKHCSGKTPKQKNLKDLSNIFCVISKNHAVINLKNCKNLKNFYLTKELACSRVFFKFNKNLKEIILKDYGYSDETIITYPKSLEKLIIVRCNGLNTIGKTQSFSNLKFLVVHDCLLFTELTPLKNLQYLSLKNLENFKFKCIKKLLGLEHLTLCGKIGDYHEINFIEKGVPLNLKHLVVCNSSYFLDMFERENSLLSLETLSIWKSSLCNARRIYLRNPSINICKFEYICRRAPGGYLTNYYFNDMEYYLHPYVYGEKFSNVNIKSGMEIFKKYILRHIDPLCTSCITDTLIDTKFRINGCADIKKMKV